MDVLLRNDEFLREEEADFQAGAVVLHRRTVFPQGSPWARLILFHGYGDHGGRYRHVMKWFAARGVVCHAFDLRGHGKASGRRGYIRRWDEFLEDAAAVLKEESQLNHLKVPRFILGHSHGGLILATGVIRQKLDADGVILCSPYLQSGVPVSPARLAMARAVGLFMPWAQFKSGMQDTWITSDLEMRADSRADPLVLRIATPRWYVSMLKVQLETRRRAGEFKLPLLCLAGEADTVALPGAVAQFFESAASAQKKLIRYPQLLHELLRETGRELVFEDILLWMRGVAEPGAADQAMGAAGVASDGAASL